MENNQVFDSEEEFDDTEVETPKLGRRRVSVGLSKAPLSGQNYETQAKWRPISTLNSRDIRQNNGFKNNQDEYNEAKEDELVKTTKLISDDNQLVSPNRKTSLASSPTKINLKQSNIVDEAHDKEYTAISNPVDLAHEKEYIRPTSFYSTVESRIINQDVNLHSVIDSPSRKNTYPLDKMNNHNNTITHLNIPNSSPILNSVNYQKNSKKRNRQVDTDIDIIQESKSKKRLNEFDSSKYTQVPVDQNFPAESLHHPIQTSHEPQQNNQFGFQTLQKVMLPQGVHGELKDDDEDISRASILEKVNLTLEVINEQAANTPVSPIMLPILPSKKTAFNPLKDITDAKEAISDEDLIRKIDNQMLKVKSYLDFPYHLQSPLDFKDNNASNAPSTEFKPNAPNNINEIKNGNANKSGNPIRNPSPLKNQSFPIVESTPKKSITEDLDEEPKKQLGLSKELMNKKRYTHEFSDEEWTKLYHLLDKFSPEQIANSKWLLDELKCSKYELKHKIQFLLRFKENFAKYS